MDDTARHRIGIVGLGYVGLPLALAFARAGAHVVGLDSDSRRVEAIRLGESYVEDVPADELRRVVDQGLVDATSNYDDLAVADDRTGVDDHVRAEPHALADLRVVGDDAVAIGAHPAILRSASTTRSPARPSP